MNIRDLPIFARAIFCKLLASSLLKTMASTANFNLPNPPPKSGAGVFLQ
jgi:hypothetical protein